MKIKRKISISEHLSEDDVLQIIKFHIDKKYKNFSLRIVNGTLNVHNLTSAFMGSLNFDRDMMRMFRRGIFFIERKQDTVYLRFKFTNLFAVVLSILTVIPFVIAVTVDPWPIGLAIGIGLLLFSAGITLGVYGTATQLMEDAEKAIRIGKDYMMDEIRSVNNKT